MKDVLIAGIPCTMFRISYVGENGWEIYTRMEHGLALWDTIAAAGEEFGIVPVGIGGSEDAMPKGSKGIRPVKLSIDIGTPIYPPASVNGRVSRKAVRDLTEQLRQEIQVLFDRSQERVGKPNEHT